MATPERTPGQSPQQAPEPEHLLVPEEIDSSKWEMPPWGIVGAVLLVILIAIGVVSYLMRPQPKATGSIDEIFAVAMAENQVMTTVKINLENVGGKPLWIRNVQGKVVTEQGEFTDVAANAVDFPRYFAAYPDLREHTMTPIKAEDRIAPREMLRGSLIFTFPVSYDQFNNRKSMSVIIAPYDQNPVTLTK
ncbi:MAG TPA: hypothetical protein VD837_10400 [Terriglobales bacterium]|nr:hypothetical protein [Terriglobales bacterium]